MSAEGNSPQTETEGEKTGDIRYPLPKRIFLFFLPFIIAAIYTVILFMGVGTDIGYVIGAAMLSTLLILGPEISITGAFIALSAADYVGPGIWDSLSYMLIIAISVAFVDVITAFFLLWNYDLVKKVPWLGPWMQRTEDSNRDAIHSSPWRQRFALVGVSVYVMFPVHGSGGLVGTIIGRILGLNRWRVFGAVAVGAIIGTLWIAMLVQYVGEGILDFFEGDIFLLIGIIITIVILALVASFIWKNRKKKKLANSKSEEEPN
jgi:uncharacterized membrane protein